jgi:hypothetical protein
MQGVVVIFVLALYFLAKQHAATAAVRIRKDRR